MSTYCSNKQQVNAVWVHCQNPGLFSHLPASLIMSKQHWGKNKLHGSCCHFTFQQLVCGEAGMRQNRTWFLNKKKNPPQIFVYFCSSFILPTHSTLNHTSAHTFPHYCYCLPQKPKLANSNVFRKVGVKGTQTYLSKGNAYQKLTDQLRIFCLLKWKCSIVLVSGFLFCFLFFLICHFFRSFIFNNTTHCCLLPLEATLKKWLFEFYKSLCQVVAQM